MPSNSETFDAKYKMLDYYSHIFWIKERNGNETAIKRKFMRVVVDLM